MSSTEVCGIAAVRFRHVRSVCGSRSSVRVAPDINVYGDEVVSGSIALSSRRDGTKTRALGLSYQRPGIFDQLEKTTSRTDQV